MPAPFTPRGWLGERSDGHRLHAGIDLGSGSAYVRAPEAASVELVAEASYAEAVPRFSRPSGWSGYGPRAVVLAGASGRWHLLAHLGDVHIRPGDIVQAGQTIGRISPRASHVHWEVRERLLPPHDVATVEVALDPLAWLEGRSEPWTPAICPSHPVDDDRTPRACRPSSRREEPPPLPPERARPGPIIAARLSDSNDEAAEVDGDSDSRH